ncbi:MAG: class I SAM-dependent methyltransferase, partial [Clostridia bacterium]|nr:class I SAM-dependent methyltransferase [Clostridia bacterium]
TRERLERENAPRNYTLINDSHHKLLEYIKEPIKAGMFNLGWLPGGDKSVTTRSDTTLAALRDAISILAPDGIILVALDPGHAEGETEGELIGGYLETLDRHKYCCAEFRIVNSPASSYFYVIESK